MRHYFKPFLIVLGLLLFTFGCQKDDSLILEEEAQIESLKAFNITSREIPTHIFNFLKTKTNNNFGVSIIKNKIKLSSTSINEFSRDTPLGIVQTNKVVQVYNERNTKYTFNVSSPTNADSVINLVVVDMGGDIIEYFIEYIFDPNNPVPMLPSGGIDMRNFTGAMIFYNFNGETIGNYILIDGTLVTFEGRTTPCDDDEDIDYNESDNENGGGTNGSTAQNDPSDPNHNGNDNDGENLGPSGEGEFVDTDYVSPCISISYQPCCDGLANGHGVEECGCGSGSPTTISDSCTGSSITFTNARNATSREGGNTENTSSPCDGETGVIIEIIPIEDMKADIETCLGNEYDSVWFDNADYDIVSDINGYLNGNCSEESKDFIQLAKDAIDEGGEVDFPNKIILDSSFVNNVKLKCAYDKLTSDNNPLFRNTVGTFIDDPKFNLTFKVGNCATTNDQCTDTSDPYNITITFEDVGLDPVEMASAILHEAIHAEMARFIEQYTTGENVNDRPRIFQLYKYYKDLYTIGDINHIYMTETYITPISSALKQFDNNSYSSNHYKSFAWDGLRDWDANNYLGMDPLSDSYGTYRNLVIENSTVCD